MAGANRSHCSLRPVWLLCSNSHKRKGQGLRLKASKAADASKRKKPAAGPRDLPLPANSITNIMERKGRFYDYSYPSQRSSFRPNCKNSAPPRRPPAGQGFGGNIFGKPSAVQRRAGYAGLHRHIPGQAGFCPRQRHGVPLHGYLLP